MPSTPLPQALFFGCGNDDKGHFFWQNDTHKLWMSGNEPLHPKWLANMDGIFVPRSTQEQGAACLHYLHGATVLAWHDYTVDSRPGSNAAFIYFHVREPDDDDFLNIDDMEDLLHKYFPKIAARFEKNPIHLIPLDKF